MPSTPTPAVQGRAVRFDAYGGREVLSVREVPVPAPGGGEVLVAVRAAGINPSEVIIRSGAMHERLPATFSSGQCTDLAGIVVATGSGLQGFEAGGVGTLVGQLLVRAGVEVLGIASASSGGGLSAHGATPIEYGDGVVRSPEASELGVRIEGAAALAEAEAPGVLRELADLLATGALGLPIAATYPLERVADAFAHLERRHTLGEIVLLP